MTRYEVGIGLAGALTPGEYREIAVVAERGGFDAITVFGDLMFQPPALVLHTMAEVTATVRLGIAAYSPWTQHPIEIAGQIAYLDRMSRGRLFYGLVRGAWLDQLGIDQSRSLSAIRDTVEIVSRLLRGDAGGYEGPVYSLEPRTTLRYEPWRPVVPLLIGTWSKALAHYASAVADEIQAGGSANPEMVGHLRQLSHDEATGRGPKICLNAVTVVDEDHDAAIRAARAASALYFEVVARLDPTIDVDEELMIEMRRLLDVGEDQRAGALIPERILDKFAFAGTPAEVAQRAARIIDAGAHRVEFDTPFGLDTDMGLRLLTTEVVPRVHALLRG